MEPVETTAVQAAPAATPLARRRPAAPRAKAEDRRKRFNWLVIACMALSLCIGFGGGALWMRRRQQGQEVIFAINGTTIDKNTLFHRLDTTSGTDVVHTLIEEELLLQFVKLK